MDRLFLLQTHEDDYTDRLRNYTVERYVNRHLDKCLEVGINQLGKHMFDTGVYKSVPVGNLEYVGYALEVVGGDRYHGMKPIEVPEALESFLYRRYERRVLGSEVKRHATDKVFIKDVDTLKNWNNLLYLGMDCSRFIEDDTHYSVSSLVDIRSEFRVFVLLDECRSIQNYLGDVLELPDKHAIRGMIEAYKADPDRPKAYTLDVAVADTGYGKQTVVLEVHNFVACGLYGFYDEILLDMYNWGWQYELSQLDK